MAFLPIPEAQPLKGGSRTVSLQCLTTCHATPALDWAEEGVLPLPSDPIPQASQPHSHTLVIFIYLYIIVIY